MARTWPATVGSRAGRVQTLVAAAGSPVRRRSVVLFTASPSRERGYPARTVSRTFVRSKHMFELFRRPVKLERASRWTSGLVTGGPVSLAPAKSSKWQDPGEWQEKRTNDLVHPSSAARAAGKAEAGPWAPGPRREATIAR